MNLDVIAIGDTTLDVFLTLDESEADVHCDVRKRETELCFSYGSKIPVAKLSFSLGGNAPNVAAGLTRLGFKAGLYSIIGTDEIGRIAEEKIKTEGIDLSRLVKTEGNTSYSTVINYRGERTILEKKYERHYVPGSLVVTPYLYISSLGSDYQGFFAEVAGFAEKNGIGIGFNPAQPQLRSDFKTYEPLVKAAQILFLNKEEAEQMLVSVREGPEVRSQKTEVKEMLAEISKLGPKYVVITDAERGAYCFDGDNYLYCQIFPVKKVEATGAGDAFASGFMGALMHGKNAAEAMKWGMVNSAFVVTKIGAVAGLLSSEEIETKLRADSEFGPVII